MLRGIGDWPIAYKLTAAVLLFVLAPLSVVAYLNVEESKQAVEQRERRALKNVARGGAQLLAERVDGAVKVARLLATDPIILGSLRSVSNDAARRESPEVHAQLVNAAQSDPAFEHVYLLDARGRCIGSSLSDERASLIGQDFSNRPYFTAVVQDREPSFVTDLLKSKNTPGTAVYLSAGVVDAAGRTNGVAVVKLQGDALHSLVRTLSMPDQRAWLVDRRGIIVSEAHGGRQQAFGSQASHTGWATAALSAEVLAELAASERFHGLDARGVEVDYLAGIESRHLELPHPDQSTLATSTFGLPDGTEVIGGIAPVRLRGSSEGADYGRIAIVQEQSAYVEPLVELGRRELRSLLLGVVTVCVALFLVVRGLSRRINQLVDATEAAAGGDLSVTVSADRGDELGALARAFNSMTSKLSQAMRDVDSRRQDAEQARQIAERHQSFIRNAFGRFVSPQLVERLLQEPEALTLGGNRQEVTILMSDLRGFSSYSDRLEPEEVVALLNIFLHEMTTVIVRYDGTIDEIIGDALLVVFGAPVPTDDHAERAIACAIAMQQAMQDVNDQLREVKLPRVQMGIGVNTGAVVVGNIGSDDRLKYAVVGRNVNLTSRIESCTVGGQVLVADETVRRLGDLVRTDGEFEMWPKGAKSPLLVHDVTGIGGEHLLYLERTTDAETILPTPIPARFGVLDGVSVPELDLDASIVRLSPDGAILQTRTEPRIMSTLKIQLMRQPGSPAAGEIYAKVMAFSPDAMEARVRFSSISPELEDLVVALLAAVAK